MELLLITLTLSAVALLAQFGEATTSQFGAGRV